MPNRPLSDEPYGNARLKLYQTAITLEMWARTARSHMKSFDRDPFETLAAIRDRCLSTGRNLTNFIDDNQPR